MRIFWKIAWRPKRILLVISFSLLLTGSQCQKILRLVVSVAKYQIMAVWGWFFSPLGFFSHLPHVSFKVQMALYFFHCFLSLKGALRRNSMLYNLRSTCGQSMFLQNPLVERKDWLESKEKGCLVLTEWDKGTRRHSKVYLSIKYFLTRSPLLSQQSSWGKGKRNVCKN